jgi:hypothetical protein
MSIDCLRDCPDFGRCCRAFVIGALPASLPDDEVERRLAGNGATTFERITDHPLPELEYSLFRCNAVLADGHCGIYSDRSHVCRGYKPGTDGLCALFCGPTQEHASRLAVEWLRGVAA